MRPHLHRILCTSAFLLVAFAPDPAYAQRRGIPIPVVFGWGEAIDRVGELPESVREEVRRELGTDVSIGYHYQRAHVFWLSFWTWDGGHVLYQGDRYWKLGPAEWGQLLGSRGAETLDTPLLYRFPLGLDILAGLVVIGIVRSRLFPSAQERARRLLKQSCYREALELYARHVLPPEGGEAPEEGDPVDPEAALANAVNHLCDRGIPPDEAARNMQVILRGLAEAGQP
jgi:hypothetical protein